MISLRLEGISMKFTPQNHKVGVLVRVGLTQPDEDIRGELGDLPGNATIAGFVSHSPVLERCTIVVNHAGHGLVSKALI